MRILHIFISERHNKFSFPFAKMMEKDFNKDKHYFIQYNWKKKANNISLNNNFHFINANIFGIFKLLIYSLKVKKIICHALNINMLIFFALFPRMANKCYWFPWGGDFYWVKNNIHSNNIKRKILILLYKVAMRNMHGIITYNCEDYKFAKAWFAPKALWCKSFMYPSNCFEKHIINQNSTKNKTIVLVGHSASKTNNHVDVFKNIYSMNLCNIEIISPLSYSESDDYLQLVLKIGYEFFGERFKPILKFLPSNEYSELLSKVDIAIFNHEKQQALGNLIHLLGYGKKVYINHSSDFYKMFLDMGVKIYDYNLLDLNLISTDIATNNINIINNNFSKKKLKEDIKKIFNG